MIPKWSIKILLQWHSYSFFRSSQLCTWYSKKKKKKLKKKKNENKIDIFGNIVNSDFVSVNCNQFVLVHHEFLGTKRNFVERFEIKGVWGDMKRGDLKRIGTKKNRFQRLDTIKGTQSLKTGMVFQNSVDKISQIYLFQSVNDYDTFSLLFGFHNHFCVQYFFLFLQFDLVCKEQISVCVVGVQLSLFWEYYHR